MKVIFLDIDGVLNYELFWKNKRQHERRKQAHCSAPDDSWDICSDKIQLLNSLIEDTGAKVVISSSWRKGREVGDFHNIFGFLGFKGEIIDKTPCLEFKDQDGVPYRSVPRGCEIKAWIETNKGILGGKMSKFKYVIFDDDSDMLYWQRNNFFWVDPYCGLTPNLIYKAKNFLNS